MTSPTFAELGVPTNICQALDSRGITSPFAIQAATIVDAMNGRDVCGRAPTGSGKTLAFGIPLVVSVGRAEARRPRGLVLAPTRELAEQIRTEIRSFAGKVRVGVVYGGVGYGPQLKALRDGVDILVACPGRLEDLIDQGAVSLADVDRVVLDEADRMADMGFMPAVRRLLNQTSSNRQTLLFSATLDGDIAKLTRDYQSDPIRHEVGEETPDITAATHLFWTVDKTARVGLTAEAVTAAWPAIIFCRTRHGADRLAKQLSRSEVKTAAIHGGRSQSQRTRALADFSIGRVHALVATDVAARGIHVDGVASVVHYDPPEDHKAYIHRSGRTARAGEGGVVISLVQPDQKKGARRLQRDIGLDEPVTDPDLAVVRDLTQPAARQLSPALSQEGPEGQSDTRTNDRAPDFHPRRNRSHGKRRHGTGKGGSKRAGSSQGGNSRNDNRQGGPKRNGKPGQRSNKPAAARRSGPKRSGSSQGGNSRNDNRQGGPKRNGKPGGQRRNGNGGGQHRSRNAGGQRRSAG
ncbi:MAG: DEAD/DEAH box helicase [Acidimicrobiales bacterium]|nr:DEAD/DEAH box helicase [Acidimicrobiales bacterium]